jgi:phosphoribosylanthranilate isomerase
VLAESKRRVDFETCGQLCEMVKSDFQPMKSVIVLKDVKVSEVNALSAVIKPDYIQVHGTFAQDVSLTDSIRLIRAVSTEGIDMLQQDQWIQRADIVLLDAMVPGSGTVFDWESIEAVRKQIQKPLWIAGGLSEANVGSLIEQHGIDGVDVSSGVETQGVKDIEKIRGFVEEVRRREHESEIR